VLVRYAEEIPASQPKWSRIAVGQELEVVVQRDGQEKTL